MCIRDREKQTGFKLNDLSRPVQDQHLTFEGITARPTKGFTSPNWSGIEVHGRTYAPFELNVQRLVPFHTLSRGASTSTWITNGCAASASPCPCTVRRCPSRP